MEKAISVLRVIASSVEPVTQSVVARETGLPKSTVHRVLRLLELEGVIIRTNAHYKICHDFLASSGVQDMRVHALPAMLTIYELTHLLVQLMVLDDEVVRCIEQFEASWQPVGSFAGRGATWPAGSTAAGQALLRCEQGGLDFPAERVGAKVCFDDGATHPLLVTAAVPVATGASTFAAVSVTGPHTVMTNPAFVAKMAQLPGTTCRVAPLNRWDEAREGAGAVAARALTAVVDRAERRR
uniref:helix-turn-helix domain-containing protein n=1 Tax=Lentzea alba TaxID=2714351 RepID=UPI0039BF01E5